MSDAPSFADALFKPKGRTRLAQALRREGVKRNAEFRRIAALPVRMLEGSIDARGLSEMLRAPGGSRVLHDDQAYAIKEAHDYGGAFVGTDVGSGKSTMIILTALVVGAKRPLVLMPASARENFDNEVKICAKHFRMPASLMIGSYESLSTSNNRDFLQSRMPDWIFADESHYLKDPKAARTARFLRFFEQFPDTHLCCYTGSPLDRTIKACAHLARLALRERCPFPLDDDNLDVWASAVDADVDDDARMGSGALEDFLPLLTETERDAPDDVTLAQRLFGARLRTCPGVIFSHKGTSKIPIHIRELPLTIPPAVKDAFEVLRDTWETPQGDLITDAKDMYRAARQLGQGFFYRWIWPVDPQTGKQRPNLMWLAARREWHRFVRKTIAYSQGRYDSKKEVEDACKRGDAWKLAKEYGQKDVLDRLRDTNRIHSDAYAIWKQIEPQYVPVVETVWIDRFLVHRVADWLDERPGIAWVESAAMGLAIRQTGFRYYAGGQNEILYETESCAAAIKAHSFAKNLFQFDRNLIVTPPSKGKDWEQMIGRTDRTGQKSALITVDLFLHVRELWASFFAARRDAKFAQAPGGKQKLGKAQITLLTNNEQCALKSFSDDPLWRFNRAPATTD